MRNKRIIQICVVALIAAVYAATTLILAPLSFGNIQCRISEALTMLAILCPEAILGVTIGCAISNTFGVFMGSNILGIADIFVGTLATFLAALVSFKFAKVRYKKIPVISCLAPIVFNAIFIGAELAFVSGNSLAVFVLSALEVGIGEAIAVAVLGVPLALRLEKLEVTKKIGVE